MSKPNWASNVKTNQIFSVVDHRKSNLCPCHTNRRKMTVVGLLLHSVGCPQPRAQVFVNNWSRADSNVCPHAVIDGYTGATHQLLDWDTRGWHAGRGSRGSYNDGFIGVEMAEPACISYLYGSTFSCSDYESARAVAVTTYNAAVKLFAALCTRFELDPALDIKSHSEAHAQGYASNHGDPEHLWRQLGLPYTMDGFREDVLKQMYDEREVEEVRYNTIAEMPAYAREAITFLVTKGYLNGKGGKTDAQGYPADLDLTEDMIRVFVVHYRAGVYK